MTNIFHIFKIGIGPSSSHTVGPMRAAKAFITGLDLAPVQRFRIELYGSLGLTGRGHGTDRAVILGLLGEEPDKVDPAQIDSLVESKQIRDIDFEKSRDIVFRGDLVMPGHPNAMRFTALDRTGAVLRQEMYYSIGGRFITRDTSLSPAQSSTAAIPYPFSSAAELLEKANAAALPIWAVILENEKASRTEAAIRDRIRSIRTIMQECTERGACCRDRDGAQSRHDLRSHRRTRADPLYRAQCIGAVNAVNAARMAMTGQGRAQSHARSGDQDHVPDGSGHAITL